MADTYTLDLSTLENWLWEAACAIRGPVDAPKFKDYILPLIFLKRLSDVFDDERNDLQAKFGPDAQKLVERDHDLVSFYLPPEARWEAIRTHPVAGLGQYLTDAMRAVARANPRLQGVIDMVDFNATAAGQRLMPDEHLANLIEVLSRHRLGLKDVEPDLLGRAYEYLLRKFAEDSGQSAGEFYTPREVAILMARLIAPQPGMHIYDPCCGSGGLLIKCHLRLLETHGVRENGRLRLPTKIKPLRLFGQEINPTTFAMARMNAVIHNLEADIRIGDTMRQPAFKNDAGQLQTFDAVVANPMWNQSFESAKARSMQNSKGATYSESKDTTSSIYENDPYHRFEFGAPPSSSADWGWIQHMLASLKPNGRMAVVLDTGAVSRGSGNQGSNRERNIRKQFVEKDLIEAVILLPENLFYNTSAPGIILVVNRNKRHPGEILLINASQRFAKGRRKNYLTEEDIAAIERVYRDWRAEPGFSAIITREEAARNDYNLSPSRYVSTNNKEEILPLEEAVVLLREAEEERAAADARLNEVLEQLGLGGLKG